MRRPILLTILDGYGYSNIQKGNALLAAKTPNLDEIAVNCPTTLIHASGLDVGLPNSQAGNSEVGHTNLGSGRIVYQSLTRISKSIDSGEFFNNKELINIIGLCKKNNKNLHIMGLASNGGVHSHLSHLYALLELVKKQGMAKNVYLHCFTDGRDVDIKSGDSYIAQIEKKINEIGLGKIAVIMGRYHALDRDNRWDRTQKAYEAMVDGEGIYSQNIHEEIIKSYDNNITDEFIQPIICDKNGLINKGDSIIFFNFRPDRARQITRAFVDKEFNHFKRKKGYLNVSFVCMTQYDKNISNVRIAFLPQSMDNTLGEYISKKGLKQLRIAETEKYAHVTFFFNGGVEQPYENEDRILIPSPKVATYDECPQMSADEITSKTIEAIQKDIYDLIILNFANCDMVGHTGSMPDAITAAETVDKNIKLLKDAILNKNGIMIITSDHGNAEQMITLNEEPMTSHTNNPVIFSIIGYECELKKDGKLADVAPTILQILDLDKPKEMTGTSLIKPEL